MDQAQTLTIPYEKQSDPHADRMCGAACLTMVYRSLGVPATQQEVWTRVARSNVRGRAAGATYLVAQDALNRGLAAVAIQARNPVQALRRCEEHGIRAILNHRLKEDASTGHYTVLVGVGKQDVALHDPLYGPSRQVPQAELLDLWRPRYLNAEIVGNVLVGIAPRAEESAVCPACQTPIPPSIACPGCGKPVPLRPAALLGCMNPACPERQWEAICCPFCDYLWRTDGAAAPPSGEAASRESAALARAMAELDKALAFMQRPNGPAHRPDFQEQIKFLQEGKGRLQEALAQRDLHLKQRQARADQLKKEFEEKKAVAERAKAEPVQPAPTPDGNALGLAMAKTLGFVAVEPAQKAPAPPPVPAEPPAKKPPKKVEDLSIVRKALQKAKKPPTPEDYDSLKTGE
jgi:hypothetical protein